MNLKIRNFIILSAIISLGALSCEAKISGSISKQHFYDLEKTIMPEVEPETSFSTEKYWAKNLFYSNKYRPLFMLSNKELINLKTEKKISVINKFNAPSVYNISLKSSSINTVSLSNKAKPAPEVKQKNKPEAKPSQKTDLQSISLYESAKNQGIDSDQKIETAILLQDTKNPSNYLLAIDLLDDVTRKEPYNAYAYYLKGELYSSQNDTESAMKNYIEALKLNPYSKQSCLGIAKILEPKNKALAQKYFEMASAK